MIKVKKFLLSIWMTLSCPYTTHQIYAGNADEWVCDFRKRHPDL